MYGVILKDPGGGLMPFVNRAFPDLTPDDVYSHWLKGNVGELSSEDFFRILGYGGDLKTVEREYLETIEIDEGFYAAAAALRKRFRLALLSNDLSEWSRFLRGKYGIDYFFDEIIISGDVGIKKPDPQIFLLTLDKMRLRAADCIYIDDRRRNLAAAASVGMDVILYNSRNVEYAGKTVNNFGELLGALNGNR